MSAPRAKKVTYNELSDRITIAFQKLMEIHSNMDYIHTLVLKYIKFNDNEKDFLKFVEKERETVEKKVRQDERKVEQGKGEEASELGERQA